MNSRKRYKALVDNVVSQYGLQIAKYLFPLITIPYLTRVLGTDGFGVRAYMLAVMTLAQTLVDYGFNLSATRSIVQNSDDSGAISRVVSSVLAAKVGIVAVTAVGLGVAVVLIPVMRENAVYAVIAFAAVALNAFLPDYLFMGKEQMRTLTVRYVVSKGIATVLTFVVVRSDGDLLLVPVIDVVSSLVALAWTWRSASKSFGIKLVKVEIREAWAALRESSLYFLTNFSASLFNTFSTIAIGIFVGNLAEIAYWSLSMTFVNAVQSLYSPISTALYPHMIAKRDGHLIQTILIWSIPILGFVLAAVFFFSRPLMMLIGGAEYAEGAMLLRILSPILVFSFYGILLGWPVLGALDKRKQIMATTMFAGAFSVVSVVIFGLTGLLSISVAAILRVITELILAVARACVAARSFNELVGDAPDPPSVTVDQRRGGRQVEKKGHES